MRKILIVCFSLLIAFNLAAQTKKKDLTVEEAANARDEVRSTDDVVAKEIPSATRGTVYVPPKEQRLPTGNLFVTNWGITYRIQNLPAYSLGAGMIFPLSDMTAIETSLALVNGKISEGTKYSGATSVTGGSITYSDVDLTMKWFFNKNFWFGLGAVYETMLDGYYIDSSTTHVPLTAEEEPSRLAVKLSFGLLSPISTENYAAPSFNLRYNIPTKFKFDKKDIFIGVTFSMAMKLGDTRK
jgi:hypothetical protein